jgi:hypothetical protein
MYFERFKAFVGFLIIVKNDGAMEHFNLNDQIQNNVEPVCSKILDFFLFFQQKYETSKKEFEFESFSNSLDSMMQHYI